MGYHRRLSDGEINTCANNRSDVIYFTLFSVTDKSLWNWTVQGSPDVTTQTQWMFGGLTMFVLEFS